MPSAFQSVRYLPHVLMDIFSVCDLTSTILVWALYPESNQRTLEEMDLLFAADTPWTWDAERTFKELKEQHSMSAITNAHHENRQDVEAKARSSTSQIEETKAM